MISVICPCLNEKNYIRLLLDFFVNSSPQEKELILVDGGSDDGSIPIIENYLQKHPNISLLHNPRKYVPYALNMAIARAKGDIIVRLDAHTEYASDYFTQIIDCFENTRADIVGGPMRAIGKTGFQQAVAYATSTKMGIGNSQFHFEEFSGYTDSVYLGAWKKNIFVKTGLFDEKMKRNQDDEFHYRAKALGFKTYQDNMIKSYYYPRDSASKLFKQYFEYGLYKPLVLKKIKSEIKLRHLVPAGFVIYLFSLLFLQNIFWFTPLFIYILAALFFSVRGSYPLIVRAYIFCCYFILHFAYGAGFILGLGKLFQQRQ
jgi:succinoglycan biosynthesis protein ExoA